MSHATPAGFASSVANRGMEKQIATQYLDQADVLLGGGAKYFEPDGLFRKFETAGYAVVRDRDALLASRETKLLGIFGEDHLPFTVDHLHDAQLKAKVPTLAEMTAAALDRFLSGDAPFLLMVEGGRVDHAAHLNCIAGVLYDQLAFDDAVATTLAKTAGRDDILVVVTSDHGNSNPALNGIGLSYHESNDHFAHASKLRISHERFQQVWRARKGAGKADLKAFIEEHLHFTAKDAELDAIDVAMRTSKADDWNHQHRNWEGLLGQVVGNHTGIGWTGVSHTSDPTLVSAIGPDSARFGGLVVNAEVNRHLKELLIG
jgi:alkaline phosphatase